MRSDFGVPRSSTRRSRSSYGVGIGTPISLRPVARSRNEAMPTISDAVTTPDGSCPVTLAIPAGDGPWAVVGPDGDLLAVYESFRTGEAKPAVVVAT